ncbi:MAG: hypothetical protein EYC70_12795 [Planctomycetota bacterium]|nr:MAG: hypothetical protein EYC70_12795 [Planctomycetota bacterium]
MTRCAAGLGVFGLAWLLLSGSGEATPRSYRSAAAGVADYWQVTPAGAWATSLFSGGNRSHLPSSASLAQGTQCSVDSSDNSLENCSTEPGQSATQCSARGDSGGKCSVLQGNGGNTPSCSVFKDGSKCSTMERGGTGGSSFCSTQAKGAGCSVYQGNAQRQCSAFSGGQSGTGNFCSVFQGSADGTSECSVLSGTENGTRECSVIGSGQGWLCTSQVGSCSVKSGSRGRCTAISGAGKGQCSAHGAGARCSVIGNPKQKGDICVGGGGAQ